MPDARADITKWLNEQLAEVMVVEDGAHIYERPVQNAIQNQQANFQRVIAMERVIAKGQRQEFGSMDIIKKLCE